MKTNLILAAGIVALGLATGCQSVPPGAERGPHGTIAYDVLVEASPPGARIEANGQSVGVTPVHIKIFGDKDGTFHDFGSYYYVVRALPLTTNQYPQIRVFGTGRFFSHEDYIPNRIYFDMTQPAQPPPSYPGYPPPPVYYAPPPPYPYYGPPIYYGPPYYYGPGFRFYFGGRHW